MPRKIALVGTAASRVGAPIHDQEWEVWGVSSRSTLARADRWYELHPLDVTFDKPGEADLWRAELKRFTADIPELVMLFPEFDLHANVRVYPEAKIRARFDTYHLMSTFSWMVAEAIDEICPLDAEGRPSLAPPGTTIGIWGVDMEYGSEYEEQRAGFRAMISIAKALGIAVHRVLDGGLIYEPVPYPHWQLDPLLCKLAKRNREAKETLADRNKSLRVTEEMMASVNGAMAEIDLMARDLSPFEGEVNQPEPYDPKKRRDALEKRKLDLLRTSHQCSADIVAWEAIDAEQSWLKGYLMSCPSAFPGLVK
jgi:hypothetical protein